MDSGGTIIKWHLWHHHKCLMWHCHQMTCVAPSSNGLCGIIIKLFMRHRCQMAHVALLLYGSRGTIVKWLTWHCCHMASVAPSSTSLHGTVITWIKCGTIVNWGQNGGELSRGRPRRILITIAENAYTPWEYRHIKVWSSAVIGGLLGSGVNTYAIHGSHYITPETRLHYPKPKSHVQTMQSFTPQTSIALKSQHARHLLIALTSE